MSSNSKVLTALKSGLTRLLSFLKIQKCIPQFSYIINILIKVALKKFNTSYAQSSSGSIFAGNSRIYFTTT